jgi:hypothetical protein
VIAFWLLCFLQDPPPRPAQTPEPPQRVLILFADTSRQPELIEQKKRIEAAMLDLADRDVCVEEQIGPGEARRRWRVPATGFLLLLIGKDGTAKMRRTTPAEISEILSLIDGMPMRRAEIEQRRGAKD